MTNEKMLEVLTVLATCDGFNAKAIAQMTADNSPSNETVGMPYRAEAILTNAIKAIKKDIITAEAKKAGNGTRQKALDSLIKDALKGSETMRGDTLTKQHKSAITGKYYITDGYTAVESSSPFQGITEETENPAEWSRFFPEELGNALDLPTVSELSAWITAEKARLKAKGEKKPIPVFDFGAGKPAFTAAFLLRAMQITNNSATKIITYGERKTAVIKSANGDRIAVCPVAIRPDVPRRDCIAEIKHFQGENA